MHRDLVLIQRFLRRLRLRSATLVIMELALIWGLAILVISVVAAGLGLRGFSAGWAQTLFWMGVFFTPALWLIKVCWPRHLPLMTLEGAARFVDRHNPQLKSSVLTALELGVEARQSPTYSPELVEVVVTQAAHEVQNMQAGLLVPNHPVRRTLFTLVGCIFIVLASASIQPGWMLTGLDTFFAMPVVALPEVALPAPDEADGPALGDIKLTLNYPAYLGRESEVLDNAAGDIRVPLGTVVEIEARVPRGADAAQLALTDQVPVMAELEDGKRLSGLFTVTGPGEYWFVMTRGRSHQPTKKYAIEIEEDAFPTIEMDGIDDKPEVPSTGQLEYAFRGRDDHGLSQLALVLLYKGKEQRQVLKSFADTPDSVSGKGHFFPEEWEVTPGARVELWLEIQDNDTVSGPKVGRSRKVMVQISSDKQRHEKTLKVKEELKENLLANLGEQLVWGMESNRLKTLDEVNNEHHKGRQTIKPVLEGFAALREAVEDDVLEELAVYTALLATERDVIDGWDNLESTTNMALVQAKQSRIRLTRLRSDNARTLDDLRQQFIVSLERAVLSMESFANLQRLDSILSAGDELRDATDELWESLKNMEGNLGDKELDKMLGKIENLEDKLGEMMREMAQLDRGSADWFQNPSQETAEMKSTLDEIKALMKAGKTEEAKAMLQDYMAQMEEMMAGLEEMKDEEFGDVRDAATKEIGQVIDGLEELEAEQERLARDTEAIADMVDKAAGLDEESLKAVFDQAIAHSEAIEKRLKTAQGEMEKGLSLPSTVERRIKEALERNDMLRSALQAKNLQNAYQKSEELQSRTEYLALDGSHRLGEPDAAGEAEFLESVQEAAQESIALHEELSDLLHQMSSARGDAISQSQGVSDRQRELKSQSQGVSKTLSEYAKDSPYIPPEWGEQVDQASQNMRSAGEKMRFGELRAAAADQRAAQQTLKNIREQMQETQQAIQEGQRGAAQQMAQQRGQRGRQMGEMQSGRPGQSGEEAGGTQRAGKGKRPGEDENWGNGRKSSGNIQILKQGQGGSDYREALMEGMRGDTPDVYKRQNRDYYEKLVK